MTKEPDSNQTRKTPTSLLCSMLVGMASLAAVGCSEPGSTAEGDEEVGVAESAVGGTGCLNAPATTFNWQPAFNGASVAVDAGREPAAADEGEGGGGVADSGVGGAGCHSAPATTFNWQPAFNGASVVIQPPYFGQAGCRWSAVARVALPNFGARRLA